MSLEISKNSQTLTFTGLVDVKHQSMLPSWSGYSNFRFNAHSSSEFPYYDGNWMGQCWHKYFNSCTNLQKSLIMWFILDLLPLKYLYPSMKPNCCLHYHNEQYLDKLKSSKNTMGTSWCIEYWSFDDCILVLQTYKKLHFVIYDWPLTHTIIIVPTWAQNVFLQATVIR